MFRGIGYNSLVYGLVYWVSSFFSFRAPCRFHIFLQWGGLEAVVMISN